MAFMQNDLETQWDVQVKWLSQIGMMNPAGELTARGRACAAFADGQPLIIGTMISDGWLSDLTLPEVCAFICLFLRESRVKA